MSLFAIVTVLATAAEEGEHAEPSGLDLVLPAFAELLWGLICFAILFFLIWKKAMPALNRMLEERAASIQGQQQAAESERQQAEQVRRQYESQLADARSEAGRIIEEARGQAERVRADIVARAEAEADQIKARAREDAQADRGRLVSDLRHQVAAMSVDLAGKIVQRELDPERHRALVDQYINELSGLS